jgi:cobalt-zinc-cadmium efflux system membrane fusion protein
MKKTIIYITLLFFVACSSKNENRTKDKSTSVAVENTVSLTENQLKNATIKSSKLERKNISSVLKMNGVIDLPPQNMVSINAPMGGYLRYTKLIPGMNIRKGELIATIEDQQFVTLQQDYLIAKAKLVMSEKEFIRQKELNALKSNSDKVFEMAQAEYTTLKITVRALAEKLRFIGINPDLLTENSISKSIQIFSPIDGYVSKVNANIGKYISPTDVLFELINTSDIHFVMSVFENNIASIFIGQKIKLYSNNNPEKKYDAEIILIGQDFDAERAVKVHCHFLSKDKSLLAGMYLNADIPTNNKNAIVVPSGAIVSFENKNYIFQKINDLNFKMVEVTLGNTANEFTEIEFVGNENGLENEYVMEGAYTLLMKMKNNEEE